MKKLSFWKKISQKFRSSSLTSEIGIFIGSICIFLCIWYIFVSIISWNSENNVILPYPDKAFSDFFVLLSIKIDGVTLIDHVLASFIRVLIGFLYAFLIGVPLGLISGSNKFLAKFSRPIIEMLRPIPPIAWIPFAIISFGLSLTSYSFIIFIGAFFPIFQNTYDGAIQSRKVYQDVALSLGASKSNIIWDVLLPSISPNIFTGSRVSFGIGWMCVIAAELMGVSNAGIGYFINYMKVIGNYSYMVAGMIMIAIVGLVLDGFFKLIEKYLLKWSESQKT